MAEEWIPSGASFGSQSVRFKSPSGKSYQMLQGWGPDDRWYYGADGRQYQSREALLAEEQNAVNQANSKKMLSDLLSGGGSSSSANPFGAAPSVSTSNRFESGLSDAESRLRALLDNPDSVQQSAAYKFRVGQGQEALQRSLGAKGLLNSGNRLMELTKYGQDMGSQEYDAQYGRLGSLLGNYSTGYVGDKNANTSRYAAESGAWNQAQANADRNRYQMGSLAWEMQKPGQVISRSSSTSGGIPIASNLGAIGGDAPQYDYPNSRAVDKGFWGDGSTNQNQYMRNQGFTRIG